MRTWLIALVSLTTVYAPAWAGAKTAPRRVFLLHSGVHIWFSHPDKNYAAKTLGRELQRRGVPERDVLVLACPFPEASFRNLVPRDGLIMFLEAMAPGSRVAHDAYRRMHQALRERGVGPKDEIVWIAHSAGGQVGMTMAHLSANLGKHVALAKDVSPYRFRTVITLGTPVGFDEVPADVRVVHYFSPQDRIVRIACDGAPWILPSWGYRCTVCPTTPKPLKSCLTRAWYDVDHPDWLYEPRVLDRLWQDVNGGGSSWWSEPRAMERPGTGLAQLLGKMLEEEKRICLEELPKCGGGN